MKKKPQKTYSPRDDYERKVKKQLAVSTIECLRPGNRNKLTQKTDREGREEDSNEEAIYLDTTKQCANFWHIIANNTFA